MPKVLIVDDDADTTALLESIIKKHGYTVSFTNDSTNAFEIANSIMPDLIILDIMMPILNGIQLCKILQSTPHLKHIPVAILSALNDMGSKNEVYNAGAKVYLTKPIQSRELIQAIKELIG